MVSDFTIEASHFTGSHSQLEPHGSELDHGFAQARDKFGNARGEGGDMFTVVVVGPGSSQELVYGDIIDDNSGKYQARLHLNAHWPDGRGGRGWSLFLVIATTHIHQLADPEPWAA